MEEITCDLFDIANRLKEIDSDYAIYRNEEANRWEVRHRGLFTFVVPFQSLDERTLVYTKKTRRENASELEREIDESNQKIEAEKQKNVEIIKTKIKEYVLYDYQRFN
jgi:hypothetical protein